MAEQNVILHATMWSPYLRLKRELSGKPGAGQRQTDHE